MRKKGYSVLELTVVLAVLAVLAGVMIPSIKGLRDQSDAAKVKADLGMIQTALESYYIHQAPHAYPDRDQYATAITAFLSDKGISPRVVLSPLYDPFVAGGATEYFYHVSDNGKYYVVTSAGLNREADNTKVDDKGEIKKSGDHVICVTNGSGC